jgi:hypothetical protein
MAHPLVFGVFGETGSAAAAVQAARQLGLSPAHLSVVLRNHDEEVAFSREYGGSPGAELEDSRTASRLAEFGASVAAALALVLPGIGPIVAGGPLGTELGDLAGHAAGDLRDVLKRTGIDEARADAWQEQVAKGGVLVGAHATPEQAPAVLQAFKAAGADDIATGTWSPN